MVATLYRSLYLLSVPADKTTILDWGRPGSVSSGPILPPQEHPVGDNEGGADYQEPDDNMEDLTPPDWFELYEDRPDRGQPDRERGQPDRERDWREDDYYDYLENERRVEREWERSDYPFHDFNYGP